MGAYETPADCDGNGIPDAEDILGGTFADCNGNGVPDDCEIEEGSTAPGGPFFCTAQCASDCNENGIPDECDIGTISDDCDENGVPDICGQLDDCNGNGEPDVCDIRDGARDADDNGIPDECERPVYAIGQIPPLTAWHERTLEVYIYSDDLDPSAEISFVADPAPLGETSLDPVTGLFTYTPDLQDKVSFHLTFVAV